LKTKLGALKFSGDLLTKVMQSAMRT